MLFKHLWNHNLSQKITKKSLKNEQTDFCFDSKKKAKKTGKRSKVLSENIFSVA